MENKLRTLIVILIFFVVTFSSYAYFSEEEKQVLFERIKSSQYFNFSKGLYPLSFSKLINNHFQEIYSQGKNGKIKSKAFQEGELNFIEKVSKTYLNECRIEERLKNDSYIEDLLPSKEYYQTTADPFDRGASAKFISSSDEQMTSSHSINDCQNIGRRTVSFIPKNLLRLYFDENEIDNERYYYVANVSHYFFGESQMKYVVARIPKTPQRVFIQQVDFSTKTGILEEKKIIQAAHFQVRLFFQDPVLMREQRFSLDSPLKEFAADSLIYSVEANEVAGNRFNLFVGFNGLFFEDKSGYMNVFRLKTFEAGIYDWENSRKTLELKLKYPVRQFPIAFSKDEDTNAKSFAQLLENMLDQAESLGQHNTYNTISRSCSIMNWDNFDRENLLNLTRKNWLNSHLPSNTLAAIKERGIFDERRVGEYATLFEEVCLTHHPLSEMLKCQKLSF